MRGVKYILIVLIITSLAACSKGNNETSQTVLFTGDYARSGFKPGAYGSELGALNLSINQVKITCPDGYVIPSTIGELSFGPKLPQATCDRKGGCQTVTVLLINPKTFSVKKESVPADKLTYMQANNKIALGAVCVKKDQVKNWV
ncbi:hypothetical protein CDV26_10645 [Francisella halioticida]|uniref:Lipoprotein n=1 Tax=Francisella halioticida TaxID=549298 RepID=A0ABM6M1R3_9GAMM|nr:hypothetical protein [Francisella halioticida]ASG68775.1 hypothetical protein CDV26_10645 [Francisella halioticida]